jgi:hypothetical protein
LYIAVVGDYQFGGFKFLFCFEEIFTVIGVAFFASGLGVGSFIDGIGLINTGKAVKTRK